jgi:tripartite-type tricarboxylate transporter receptor subunit TctC
MDATRVAAAISVLAGLLSSGPAASQEYPSRTVRIITSTPGNFHDIVARRIALSLSEKWHQPVIVENRGGAGATLAATAAAQAAADGYTLLVSDRTGLTVSPVLYHNLAYDPFKDLAPITLLAAAPMLLIAQPSVPAATLEEFIAYLRRSKNPVEFASAGPGTAPHLLGELLKQSAGVDLVNVHYKGSPAAMMGLLAGETKAAFMLIPVALPHVRSGKVRAFATSGRQRFPGAPDIPTLAELGMPELESELWLALMAPGRTPAPIIDKVSRDVVEILKTPAMRGAMIAQGAEVAYGTPAELEAYMRSETAKWKKVIQIAGVRID